MGEQDLPRDDVDLRKFLYLDVQMVDEFLSQLDDGIYETVRSTGSQERRVSGEAKTGVPGVLGAKGELGEGSTQSEEFVRRSTPESRFNRLHKLVHAPLLDEDDEDEELGAELRPRRVVEITCSVEIPEILKALSGSSELTAFGELLQLVGGNLEAQEKEALDGMQRVSNALKGDALLATTAIQDRGLEPLKPLLAFRLLRSQLRVPLADMEGEVMILAKVQQSWGKDESKTVLSLPGIGLMSRERRRELARSQKGQPEAFSLPGPGVTFDAIAVYR